MTNLEMLRRYEETERLAQSLVPHEGEPWYGDVSFDTFRRHMTQQIAQAMAIPRHVLMRANGLKPCLSCGAYQTIDGTLPCGH